MNILGFALGLLEGLSLLLDHSDGKLSSDGRLPGIRCLLMAKESAVRSFLVPLGPGWGVAWAWPSSLSLLANYGVWIQKLGVVNWDFNGLGS